MKAPHNLTNARIFLAASETYPAPENVFLDPTDEFWLAFARSTRNAVVR
jgi:hypothetical protein